MVKVYAVLLVIGAAGLIAWILFSAHAENENKPSLDPERRFGTTGRRVVGGLVGFGMAGMSAEFSPRDLSWQLALGLAVLGGAAAVWWSGRDPQLGGDPGTEPGADA
jgi:hypothetical protein